jgi:hypothetical protein
VTFSFVDERQVLNVIQPMHPLHECDDSAAVEAGSESAAEPLHSVGDSAAIEESVVEPLQSAADAPTETSCS